MGLIERKLHIVYTVIECCSINFKVEQIIIYRIMKTGLLDDMSRTSLSRVVMILLLGSFALITSISSGTIDSPPAIATEEVGEENNLNLFAFYYPWYGTPSFSGDWIHWQEGITNHPLVGKYDSNDESLIRWHIDMARRANIDGFVVSWWGRDSFEDKALSHIKNVCEQNDFKFTIYYEWTASPLHMVNDILYLLDNYANSCSWYRIDGRPVIYVYSRTRNTLNPQYGIYWRINGDGEDWLPYEEVRNPCRHGIFLIHPYEDDVGYVQSNWISLPENDTYNLKVSISVIRDDCPPYSDVGFRIKIRDITEDWQTLDALIVNFDDGWLDLTYDISSYAGETVLIRVESFAGGVYDWCSEWAAVDYFYVVNSEGGIINQNPYLDNELRLVIDDLNAEGYNPYIIVDSWNADGEYFLDFADGVHTYLPDIFSLSMSEISEIYTEASNIAHSKNKTFVATVAPGYDDTNVRSPGNIVDRQNGSFYNSFWSAAKSSFPDEYIITSFNEWHEGTEIEPSLEYQDLYINLTYSNTLELLVHDVAITDISPSKTVVFQDSITSINVTVENQGDCIEHFNVTLYANSTVIGRQTVNGLAYGTENTLQIICTTTDISIGNYRIKAVASQVSGETDITDNVLLYDSVQVELGLQTDLNGDRKVNILDIAIVAKAYGTTPEDPNWNSIADVAEPYNEINILDIATVAKDYGKTV